MTQLIFEHPTDYFDKLHGHLTDLKPGAGCAPHTDAHDVAIVVLSGRIETIERVAAANAAKTQSSAPSSPAKTQDLVFPATIQVTQRSLNIDGKEIALIPGMGVSVEIKTGRRRAIDYLLSPLREIGSRAGSET